jgi:hypothetical protein
MGRPSGSAEGLFYWARELAINVLLGFNQPARIVLGRNVTQPYVARKHTELKNSVSNEHRHPRNSHIDATSVLRNRWMRTAPMPRRPGHQAGAAYTNATVHPLRGRHRTTRYKSGNVRSRDSCRPHRRVRRPDTNAPGPLSRLPFLPWAQPTSCRYSTHLALTVGKLKALLRSPRH